MCHCFGKKTTSTSISHSASYNISATTTTTSITTNTAKMTMHAFSICATTLGKTPPPPPSHSANYNITANHHYHHRHHLDHHSTNYNACIQYMRHCFRKKNRPPVQVTVGLLQHQHPSVHDAASTCDLHKGMPLNFCPYPIQWHMPLCKLTCACSIVHANGSGVVFAPL